jgi:hypothetical protein
MSKHLPLPIISTDIITGYFGVKPNGKGEFNEK